MKLDKFIPVFASAFLVGIGIVAIAIEFLLHPVSIATEFLFAYSVGLGNILIGVLLFRQGKACREPKTNCRREEKEALDQYRETLRDWSQQLTEHQSELIDWSQELRSRSHEIR